MVLFVHPTALTALAIIPELQNSELRADLLHPLRQMISRSATCSPHTGKPHHHIHRFDGISSSAGTLIDFDCGLGLESFGIRNIATERSPFSVLPAQNLTNTANMMLTLGTLHSLSTLHYSLCCATKCTHEQPLRIREKQEENTTRPTDPQQQVSYCTELQGCITITITKMTKGN